MKHLARTEQGFLVVSFLIVISVILAISILSLDLTRQLWKASQLELTMSEVQNAQRAAVNQMQSLLQSNTLPAACWHHSVKPWLSVPAFEQDPQRGCAFSLADAKHYYWLEVLREKPAEGLVKVQYQLSLISVMHGSSIEVQQYGAVLKTLEPPVK